MLRFFVRNQMSVPSVCRHGASFVWVGLLFSRKREVTAVRISFSNVLFSAKGVLLCASD